MNDLNPGDLVVVRHIDGVNPCWYGMTGVVECGPADFDVPDTGKHVRDRYAVDMDECDVLLLAKRHELRKLDNFGDVIERFAKQVVET